MGELIEVVLGDEGEVLVEVRLHKVGLLTVPRSSVGRVENWDTTAVTVGVSPTLPSKE